MQTIKLPDTHVNAVMDALDHRLTELEEAAYEASEDDPIHDEIAHLTEVIDQL